MIACFLIAIVVSSCANSQQGGSRDNAYDKTLHADHLIEKIPDGIDVVADKIYFSPHGKSVAYVGHDVNGEFVVVNGNVGKTFDRIAQDPQFLSDGNRVVYLAKTRGKYYIVTDSLISDAYDGVGEILVGHNDRIVYVAQRKGVDLRTNVDFVVDGGIQGREYNVIGSPSFSENGKHVVYNAYNLIDAEGRRAYYFVVDDVEFPNPLEDVRSPTVGANGKIIAYVVNDGGSDFVVFQDQQMKTYAEVGCPVVSPDEKTVAYEAEDNKREFIVIGTDEQEKFDKEKHIVWTGVFSPDSKKFAYKVEGRRGVKTKHDENSSTITFLYGNSFYVDAGRKGKVYDDLGMAGYLSDGRLVYHAYHANKEFVVVNEEEQVYFDHIIEPLVFDKFRTKVAYIVVEGGTAVGPDGSYIKSHNENWSGGKWFIVVGTRKSTAYEHVYNPAFSQDGKKIGFGAKIGQELWWKVIECE